MTQTKTLEKVVGGAMYEAGSSTESQRAADMDARIQLLTRIESQITGSLRVLEQETSGSEYSYAVVSESGQTVNFRIAGLQIEERWPDQNCRLFYALARLDPMKAVDAWLLELQTLGRTAKMARARADKELAQGNVFAALLALYELQQIQSTAAPLILRTTYVSQTYLKPQQRLSIPDIGEEAATRHELETTLSSIRLLKASGDEQRANANEKLPEPLEVRIVAVLAGREIPIPQVQLHFEFAGGQGLMDNLVITDQQGSARVNVQRVERSSQPARIVARSNFEDLMRRFPPGLQLQVKQQFERQQVSFYLIPPPELTLLEGAFEEVAKHIAETMKQPHKRVCLGEFAEVHTGDRHGISLIFRDNLSKAFINVSWDARITNCQNVLREDVLSDTTKNNTDGVTAELDGKYRLTGSDTVEISVYLKPLKDQHIEAFKTVALPRTAFSRTELALLARRHVKNEIVPMLPTPAPAQRAENWIEELWLLSNPGGFQTHLKPESPFYQVGQKMRFRFKTDADCYLTVFNIGTSGKLTMLVPNQKDSRERLVRKSEGWIAFPAMQDNFDFTVDPPIGSERLKAFCTLRPVRLIENANLRDGFFQLSPDDDAKARDVRVTNMPISPETWSVSDAQVDTLEQHESEPLGKRERRIRGLVK